MANLASRHPDVLSGEDMVEHVYDGFSDLFSFVFRVQYVPKKCVPHATDL
jgi:hypothetical protein